jgi:DNA-binding response OmpR family regulator
MYDILYTLQPSQESSDNNDSITIKAGRSSQHSRVLVVDDEPDITEAFKIGLEQNGFEVDVFNDPLQALSKFEEEGASSFSPHYYDLLLLDVKMPKMNGFELYRKIKKKIRKEEADDDDRDKLKVCFITAYEVYYESLKEEFPSLNIGCFLKKPIEIQELVKRIRAELKMA